MNNEIAHYQDTVQGGTKGKVKTSISSILCLTSYLKLPYLEGCSGGKSSSSLDSESSVKVMKTGDWLIHLKICFSIKAATDSIPPMH